MGDDLLSSARLKIARANHHAKALKTAIDAWLKDRPYEVTLDKDPETGEQVCRIHVLRHPPPEWSILIGEIVYGLRSALDHAVYGLSAPPGGDPPNGTEFPIFKDEAMFRNTNRPGGLWKARGLSPAALSVVDSVQPFRHGGQEPDRHLLWVLQELCNVDKHRMLNLSSTALGAMNLTLEAEGSVQVQRSKVREDGPIEDGAEMVRWSVIASGEGKVEMNGQIAVDVAFNEAGPAKGERVKGGLDMLGGAVGSIVGMLGETIEP
jgi:hypothetical protein